MRKDCFSRAARRGERGPCSDRPYGSSRRSCSRVRSSHSWKAGTHQVGGVSVKTEGISYTCGIHCGDQHRECLRWPKWGPLIEHLR
jgi:hypothetical protein